MATDKGWNLDNQAVGATTCGELTTQGRSESLWDLKIDANSVNIYAHFHNEEANWGFEASGVYYTRNCIEAQTAWLAIPESQKVRAINCAQTGTWTAGANSAAAVTTDTGATLTCTVTGTVVYLSTARTTGAGGQIGTYSITVDGNLVTDTESQSTVFSEYQNVSPQPVTNFVRVGNLQNTTHTINYTCTFAGSGCAVFYAAGLTGVTTTPIAYSLSPVPNASTVTGNNFDPATYAQYYVEWKSLVTELQGDGLNIIPIDVNNPKVYDQIHNLSLMEFTKPLPDMPQLAIMPQHCNFGVSSANSSYEKAHTQITTNKGVMVFCSLPKRKKPRCAGDFSLFCINCSEWGITHTPHECAGLAGGFRDLGA